MVELVPGQIQLNKPILPSDASAKRAHGVVREPVVGEVEAVDEAYALQRATQGENSIAPQAVVRQVQVPLLEIVLVNTHQRSHPTRDLVDERGFRRQVGGDARVEELVYRLYVLGVLVWWMWMGM